MKTPTGLNFSTWISAKIIQIFVISLLFRTFLDSGNCGISCFVFVLLEQLNQPTIKVIVENQTFSKTWTKTWSPCVCSFSVLWPTISFLWCSSLFQSLHFHSSLCFFPSPLSFLFALWWALFWFLHFHLFFLFKVFFFPLFLWSIFPSSVSFHPYSFCLLCLHSALGCSHKHRFPSATSWACLGRALSRGLTLPLFFLLSLHMVGTKRSCKLSHCPRDIPGLVRQRTTCGEWGGDNWRGRIMSCWVDSPSSTYKASSSRSLPFLGGCGVPTPFPACKGAPASRCKILQLAPVGSCLQWALFLLAGSNAYSSEGCIFFN